MSKTLRDALTEIANAPNSDARSVVVARAALAAEQAQPVAWTLAETLGKRESTTRAHLWFTDPQNPAWAALYTAPPPAPVAQSEGVRWNSTVRKLMAEWTPEQVARYTAEHARLAAEQAAPAAQQGEALEIADELEMGLHLESDHHQELRRDAAAELRRLHSIVTAQQTAVPLTDEAIQSILQAMPSSLSRNDWPIFFARMIEDAHGITPKESSDE